MFPVYNGVSLVMIANHEIPIFFVDGGWIIALESIVCLKSSPIWCKNGYVLISSGTKPNSYKKSNGVNPN